MRQEFPVAVHNPSFRPQTGLSGGSTEIAKSGDPRIQDTDELDQAATLNEALAFEGSGFDGARAPNSTSAPATDDGSALLAPTGAASGVSALRRKPRPG
jgi:hypothetical protein